MSDIGVHDDRDRRAILDAVASGEITPEEGFERLAALDQPAGGAQPDTGGAGGAGTAPDPPGAGAGGRPLEGDADVARIEISVPARSARIIGDASVTGAVAEGAHVLRRVGDTLVVDCDPDLADAHDESMEGLVVFGTRRGGRRLGVRRRSTHSQPVVIRVNPRLPLDLQVSAGSATVDGVETSIRCDVSAGSLRIRGVRGSLNGSISAGSLSAEGVFTGDSEVSCEAGSVRLVVEPGSDVTASADVSLGRLEISTPETPAGSRGRVVAGAGQGRLHVHGNLSAVSIRIVDS